MENNRKKRNREQQPQPPSKRASLQHQPEVDQESAGPLSSGVDCDAATEPAIPADGRYNDADCGGDLLLTETWLKEVAKNVIANNAADRSFNKANMPRLVEFFQHLAQCHVKVLGVRDFAYNDKRAGCHTLEREVWLLDTTQKDAAGRYDGDRAFVVMHVHTAEPWRAGVGARQVDWSKVTQINMRHSSRTMQFSQQNPQFGKIKLGKLPGQVHSECHRWPERGSMSVAVLGCRAGRLETTTQWDATAQRMLRVEQWHDWTGQSVWCREEVAAASSEDAMELDSGAGAAPREGAAPVVRWYNPTTSEYYTGPLNYQDFPAPAGQNQTPWLWRDKRAEMDCEVDPNGHMASVFRAHFAALGNQDWKGAVQIAMCELLNMVDTAIHHQNTQLYRGATDQPDAVCAVEKLEVAALLIGIDGYSKLSPLRHCGSDAAAMAEKFTSFEQNSRGVAATEANGHKLPDKDDMLDLIEGQFCSVLTDHAQTLRAVVVFAALHALQLNGEVYLVPADAGFNRNSESRFTKSINDKCIKLSEVAELITNAVSGPRQTLSASGVDCGNKCCCLFILDACRDPGLPQQFATERPNASVTEGFLSSEAVNSSFCDQFFMFSTWQGAFASDGSALEEHSPYTASLLKHLFTPGKTLMDVQKAAEAALKPHKQVPTFHGSATVSELILFPVRQCMDQLEEQVADRRINSTDQLEEELKVSQPMQRPFDIYFAVQPAPAVVHPLSSLQHQACREYIRCCFRNHQGGKLTTSDGKLKLNLCLTDGRRETPEHCCVKHLNNVGTRCLVWSTLGINMLHKTPHKAPDLFGHPSLQDAHVPDPWPAVVVVCMQYGLHRAVDILHDRGAPIVIGIPIDLCSQIGYRFFNEVLLNFLLSLSSNAVLTSELVEAKLEEYKGKEGFKSFIFHDRVTLKCKPGYKERSAQQEQGPWEIKMCPCDSDYPAHNAWFANEQLTELHLCLRSCDLSVLEEVKQIVRPAGIVHSVALVSAGCGKHGRAVALEICRHFFHECTFKAIYWVKTEEHRVEADAFIASNPDVPVLVWVDAQEVCCDMSGLFLSLQRELRWDETQLSRFQGAFKEQGLIAEDLPTITADVLKEMQKELGLRNPVERGKVLKEIQLFLETTGESIAVCKVIDNWTRKRVTDRNVCFLYTCPTKNATVQGKAFTCRQLACSAHFEDLVTATSVSGQCQSCEQAPTLHCKSCETSFCNLCASSAHQGAMTSSVHHEIRVRPLVDEQPIWCNDALALEQFKQVLMEELTDKQPLPAIYDDQDKWLLARVCVSGVKFLHRLRAKLLESKFDIEQPRHRGLQTDANAGCKMSVDVDLSSFAELYEAASLSLDRLTPHQRDVVQHCERALKELFTVHVQAAAGTGKTFVGLYLLLKRLRSNLEAAVLFVTKTEALAKFVAKWLWRRLESNPEYYNVLKRVHFAFAPTGMVLEGPYSIETEAIEQAGKIVLEPLTPENTVQYSLVVVDEAHNVYPEAANAAFIKQCITQKHTELIVLSDMAQGKTDISLPLPEDTVPVELTEVVRSTQRIVAAAMHFRATGTKLERSHCDYPGPPLKPFLFDGGDIQDFATHTVEAMEDLVDEHVPTLSLHDRLAILVPNEKFRSELTVEMKRVLESSKLLQSRKFKFVTAKEAASVCGNTHQQGDAEQWIVLDSIDEFDGLERLFVIAVGLDQRIDASGSSVFYRAITRAHMLVMVVDRRVQGGWLEFLGHVEFDASKEFSAKEERARCNGQALAIHRERQRKRKRNPDSRSVSLMEDNIENENSLIAAAPVGDDGNGAHSSGAEDNNRSDSDEEDRSNSDEEDLLSFINAQEKEGEATQWWSEEKTKRDNARYQAEIAAHGMADLKSLVFDYLTAKGTDGVMPYDALVTPKELRRALEKKLGKKEGELDARKADIKQLCMVTIRCQLSMLGRKLHLFNSPSLPLFIPAIL